MTTFRRIAPPAVVGAAVVALISACSGSSTDQAASPAASAAPSVSSPAPVASSPSPAPPSPTAVSSSPAPVASPTKAGDPTRHNAADIRFAAAMIPHHLQGLDLTILTSSRSADQWVQDLAAKIAAAQDPQIRIMKGWLEDWGAEPLPRGRTLPGSLSKAEIAKLAAAKGTAFDRLFVTMMIDHDLGAIELAQAELATGSYDQTRALAQDIATTKTAEVKEMRKYLAKLK